MSKSMKTTRSKITDFLTYSALVQGDRPYEVIPINKDGEAERRRRILKETTPKYAKISRDHAVRGYNVDAMSVIEAWRVTVLARLSNTEMNMQEKMEEVSKLAVADRNTDAARGYQDAKKKYGHVTALAKIKLQYYPLTPAVVKQLEKKEHHSVMGRGTADQKLKANS